MPPHIVSFFRIKCVCVCVHACICVYKCSQAASRPGLLCEAKLQLSSMCSLAMTEVSTFAQVQRHLSQPSHSHVCQCWARGHHPHCWVASMSQVRSLRFLLKQKRRWLRAHSPATAAHACAGQEGTSHIAGHATGGGACVSTCSKHTQQLPLEDNEQLIFSLCFFVIYIQIRNA